MDDADWESVFQIECQRTGLDFEKLKHLTDPKVREEMFPDVFQLVKIIFHHTTGILSLSETHNNALMWAHYCQNHSGYVIEFDAENVFFKQSEKNVYSVDLVSKVNYSDVRPKPSFDLLTM